jgi:hypothetical protein
MLKWVLPNTQDVRKGTGLDLFRVGSSCDLLRRWSEHPSKSGSFLVSRRWSEHPSKLGSFLVSRNIITFSGKSFLIELLILFVIIFKL